MSKSPLGPFEESLQQFEKAIEGVVDAQITAENINDAYEALEYMEKEIKKGKNELYKMALDLLNEQRLNV